MSISQYKTSKGQTRWRVRYTRPDGTRTDKRGFTTKAAARQWEARTITGDVTLSGKNEPTINDLADLYLASLNRLAKGTANGYTTALHGHILPRWGRTRPSEITRANVQHWVTSEQFTWSVATRNLAVLAGVLTTSGYSDEATKGVTKPRKNFREHTYLTYPHLSLLAAKSPYPGIIYTLGLTGVRWGECAGARVKDYNPATRELHVVQTAGMIQGKLVIGRPKSGKSRIVMVPDQAADYLDEATRGRPGDAPVFPGPSGDYMKRPKGRSWYDGSKRRAHEADETFPEHMRLHDLRHTAASLMVQSGAHVKLVQHQLGHATASMTMDIYADLFPEDLSVLRDAMNLRFSGQNVGNTNGLEGINAGHVGHRL